MEILGWIGWVLSIILAILNIWQFRKNRVGLKIECLQNNSLISEIVEEDYFYEPRQETRIQIKTHFYNQGLEPITIGEVIFLTDLNGNGKLDRIEMNASPKNQKFEKIRLNGNDMYSSVLYATIPIFLPEKIKELKGIFIFKTSHKDIKKRITLIRVFTKDQMSKLFPKK